MRLVLAIAAALLLVGCNMYAPPGERVEGPTSAGSGEWRYVDAPDGIRCLIYTAGVGNSAVLAMDCSWP